MRAEAAPDHHDSHRHLISEYDDLPDNAPGPVHAIVVPTIRHLRWLRHAVRLAQHLSCPLVSLHSRNGSNAELADAIVPSAVHLIAIDIDDVGALNLPDFATDALLRGTPFVRFTDLSAKRNLGLVLARMMDWQRIVFLDDDIEVGAPHEVSRAASLLDIYDVVGMRIGGYPDNSVVCHAYRETGGVRTRSWGVALSPWRRPGTSPSFRTCTTRIGSTCWGRRRCGRSP
ncbi:hypothetical protein [Acrocarpospora sp. B8E8]|uniref:hypothetical protein n=1 Tax=Acrocarpospora sp. B8E8 TaxID=3153572 RepID=UPI00325D8DAA